MSESSGKTRYISTATSATDGAPAPGRPTSRPVNVALVIIVCAVVTKSSAASRSVWPALEGREVIAIWLVTVRC